MNTISRIVLLPTRNEDLGGGSSVASGDSEGAGGDSLTFMTGSGSGPGQGDDVARSRRRASALSMASRRSSTASSSSSLVSLQAGAIGAIGAVGTVGTVGATVDGAATGAASGASVSFDPSLDNSVGHESLATRSYGSRASASVTTHTDYPDGVEGIDPNATDGERVMEIHKCMEILTVKASVSACVALKFKSTQLNTVSSTSSIGQTTSMKYSYFSVLIYLLINFVFVRIAVLCIAVLW